MENTTRIVAHSKYSTTGYYRIEVKRVYGWRGMFARWEAIENFIPAVGLMNPVLLPYTEAKAFAIRMKDPRALEGFNRNQVEKHAAHTGRIGEKYPVNMEVF